ncbi:Peptide chain release factor 1, mitochondrial [Tilletia horrida]|nr:Peptide chain release factor 1, mitochondrial [Tilletia horrida]
MTTHAGRFARSAVSRTATALLMSGTSAHARTAAAGVRAVSTLWLPRRGQGNVIRPCHLCRRTGNSAYSARTVSNFAPPADDVLAQYAVQCARKRIRLLAEMSANVENGADVQERAAQLKELDGVHRIWADWSAKEEQRANALKLAESDPDPDMRALAEEELVALADDIAALRAALLEHILPADPMDASDAILELRPGVGGEEASLFTGEVLRMYTKYVENRPEGFTTELLSATEVDVSTAKASSGEGYKEAIMEVKGKGAYGLLKWEAGVHRVQRVPATQSTGKLQTSAMAVVVLPVVDNGGKDEQESELFDMKEVKIEVMRSRGAGGQHVNKTESAVRLTHEPTGITVSMQDSRSQHQNRSKAFAVLRARLMDRRMREQMHSARAARQGQIGTMDRGDRIRTYNFPQDRVTDHRVGISLTGIEDIMDGLVEEGMGLSRLLDALREQNRERRLEAMLAELRAEAAAEEEGPEGSGGKKNRKR